MILLGSVMVALGVGLIAGIKIAQNDRVLG
jgi:hypothetical protein